MRTKDWRWLLLCGGLLWAQSGCDMAEYDATALADTRKMLIGPWLSPRDTRHPLTIDKAGNVAIWTGADYSRSVRPMVVDGVGRSFQVEILMPDGQKKMFAGRLLTDDRLSMQIQEKPEVGYGTMVVYGRMTTTPTPPRK